MRKIMGLILLLLMLVSSSYAQYEDEDVLTSSQIKTHLTIDSSFDIVKTDSKYKIDYVTVKLSYLPYTSYRQRIVSHITNPKAEESSDFLLFNWEKPPIGTESFSAEYVIITGSNFYPIQEKVEFPLTNIPKEIIKYTQSTDFIDVNEDIRELANQIAQGKDDVYQIVFDAAVWVNNNIEYDLSTVTAEASLPSSWVLDNRRGVCDEMTNLFISILRSLGIPAKFVSGISYTNSDQFAERWGPHGWAEVYFNDQGWVPFDPTYGQYGYIDAGHIKLKESIDSDKSSIDYEWLSYGASIDGKPPNNNVEVLQKIGVFDPRIDMKIGALNGEVGFESYNVIIATITNNVDEYRTSKIELVYPKEIEVDSKVRYVLLKPNEKKTVEWKIKFPKNLDTKSIYTFPISAYNNFNNKYVDIAVAKKYVVLDEAFVDNYLSSKVEETEMLDITLTCTNTKTVQINKEFEILCEIGNDKTSIIDVCLETNCQKLNEGKITFSKSYDSAGAYPLIISASHQGLKKVYYSQIIVVDKPSLEIEWVQFDNSINYSKSQKIVFYINQKSLVVPKNLKLSINYNYLNSAMGIPDFETTQLIQTVINGKELDKGENTITITVEYYDDEGNMYTQEFTNTINMKTNDIWELILAKLGKFSNYILGLLQPTI